jgi:hypothetical protein
MACHHTLADPALLQAATDRSQTRDSTVADSLFFTCPLCLAILLSLRQVHDSGFCVFCGYFSMARFPMLNGFFQMCDPFGHMRMIRASLQGMLQRGFRMCQKCVSMALFAMVHRFFRVLEGVLEVLLFLTHNVTPRPALAEYRLQRQHCGGD